MRYAVRHWRGELPLWTAATVSLAALWALLAVLGAVADWLDITENPRTVAALWFAQTVVAVAGAVWWGRGLQQAALNHLARDGSLLAALGAGAVGLWAMLWAGAAWWSDARHAAGDAYAIVSGAAAPARVSVDPSGTLLRLEGEFEFGTARRLRAALHAHPGVRVVHLESPGGRAIEGLRTGELIRDRGLDTFADGLCASACATAFAGGQRRLIRPGVKLGLHGAGGEGVSAEAIAQANRVSDDFMASRGIHVHVIEKGSLVPFEEVWFPEPWVLLASGLATDYWRGR